MPGMPGMPGIPGMQGMSGFPSFSSLGANPLGATQGATSPRADQQQQQQPAGTSTPLSPGVNAR